jgi:hypothetical protein
VRLLGVAAAVLAMAVLLPAAVSGAGTPVVSDAFQRSFRHGWGAADVGGSYTLTGPLAAFSVVGGSGQMDLPTAGSNRAVALAAVSAHDVSMFVKFRVTKLPTAGSIFVYAVLRQESDGSTG